jgi:hypothetical protein
MRSTRMIHCACCDLDQSAVVESARPVPNLWCVRCEGHRGETLTMIARREADHVAMYRHALHDAQDDVLLAQRERDHLRDRMKTAYDSREMLVALLSRIEDLHHARGRGCSCGKRRCRVVDLLSDPRVARLIRSYDEERRTLRELREANPEMWADSWDYIDVTLVYPEGRGTDRDDRLDRGRHRSYG